MKKILIFAGLAAAMVSCTSEEPVQVSDSYAIGFSTYVGKATRAGDVNTESLASFAVYGGTDKTEFNGTDVTKKNGVWTYSPVQYWEEGVTYKFAAVAPAVSGASYDFSANKLTVAGYSPADDDLIVATTNAIEGKAAGSNTAVALNFKHALSKVQLTFDGDLNKLSDVKLTAGNMADLAVTFDSSVVAEWGDVAASGEYAYSVDATSGKGVKYLLPQNLEEVAIAFTYNDKSYTKQLSTAEVDEWEMGKAYNYNIALKDQDAIDFTVEVAAWPTLGDEPVVEDPVEEDPTEEEKCGCVEGECTCDHENGVCECGEENCKCNETEEPKTEEPAVEPEDVILYTENSAWIRSNNTSTSYIQEHLEIKSYEDYNFYGLIKFTLPETLNVKGYTLTATLRLVTTMCKGDRNINLYDFGDNAFSQDNATYDNYGSICETQIADEDAFIATFEAKGNGNKAISDSGLTEAYTDASAWTNLVDISDCVSTKTGGTDLTIIIAKNTTGSQSFKFATQRITDQTGKYGDDNTEVTFKAEDLIPYLQITYTKE